jgi:hypothetical protein
MPLLAGKRNIGHNISEMESAGHPRSQSIAAALRKAGVKRKDPPMKKSDGMDGGKGMSPRKAMASGLVSGGGNFGVEPYSEAHGGDGMHPDHSARTGEKMHMGDSERATPPAIHHTKGHLPAQAAPKHGPHMDDWNREGKV